MEKNYQQEIGTSFRIRFAAQQCWNSFARALKNIPEGGLYPAKNSRLAIQNPDRGYLERTRLAQRAQIWSWADRGDFIRE